MTDREAIVFTIGVVAVVFLIAGLSGILVQGKEYYEDTEVLFSDSQTAQKISLLGGDTVRIKVEVFENNSIRLLVKRGNTTEYTVTATDMDLTITIPTTAARSVDYDFIIKNPHDQMLTVSYLYEVTLMHDFWTGVIWLVFSAILGVATFFALVMG